MLQDQFEVHGRNTWAVRKDRSESKFAYTRPLKSVDMQIFRGEA